MKLSLVRHAVAVDRDQFAGADHERPLTARGRKECRAFAETLVAAGWKPEILFTSPLLRALQTAEILRKVAGLKPRHAHVATWISPGMNAQRLLAGLKEYSNLPEHVAIVGHEPDLSASAASLIGGGNLKFAKSAVAHIRFDKQPRLKQGELLWLVSPRLLVKRGE